MKAIDWYLLFIVLVLGLIFGFSCGGCTGKYVTRNKAIENGVAEWTCDPVTGVTTFTWKKQ